MNKRGRQLCSDRWSRNAAGDQVPLGQEVDIETTNSGQLVWPLGQCFLVNEIRSMPACPSEVKRTHGRHYLKSGLRQETDRHSHTKRPT